MAVIYPKKNEDFSATLNRFTKQVNRDGILSTYRRKTAFKSAAEIRNEKRRIAERKKRNRHVDT